MKAIGNFFDGLDRFGGVIQAIGILFLGAKYVFDNLKKISPIYIIIIAIVLILVAIALFRKVVSYFKEYEIRKLERKIVEVNNLSVQKHDFSINSILTSRQITDWLKTTDYHAKNWSKDAVRNESNMGYSIHNYEGMLNHWLHIEYFSKIKGESISFSYGKDDSSLREIGPNQTISTYIPFYKNQPRWREAMIAVCNHLEDKWDGWFMISVYSVGEHGRGKLSFNYQFARGTKRVATGGSFDFDGRFLTKDSLKIAV